jgi:hypothetical protein
MGTLMLTFSQAVGQPNEFPAARARKDLPRRSYRLFNWQQVHPIRNDSVLIGWQADLQDTTHLSDSTWQFLLMENQNGKPGSYYLNTIQYAYHPGEKRVLPARVVSKNLISRQTIETDLWGSLGKADTSIKGQDNMCTPRCDTLSRVVLIPHPEDTVFRKNRRYAPMINSYYLGIRINPKSYSIGSLLRNRKPIRPLLNTPSYIYIHPHGGKFSFTRNLELLDMTRFKDIYVYNFYFWWTGAEYPQPKQPPSE